MFEFKTNVNLKRQQLCKSEPHIGINENKSIENTKPSSLTTTDYAYRHSVEFVPYWKVYGYSFSNATNRDAYDNRNIMLNVQLPKNLRIPSNMPLKWSTSQQAAVTEEISQQSWQVKRLEHRTRST
ncbi:uncharacterized protein LOC129577586 [Sitodiplosis mosellana]|uniref:uncharacterized protein LOC129577586 n=1 Tax=Sitodiplosis mosellana TaxID=263140 RepID=UPI0024442671|nr:uncharacterized protein LOC129577586 [Sitodiplosis mosellana]